MKFSTGDGVLYMMTGDKHANHLVVSLWSLRRAGYAGPVAILAGDEAGERWSNACASDTRLGPLQVLRWEAGTRRRGGGTGVQYANKTVMGERSPFERTVFLDADTVIAAGRAESADGSRASLADMLPDMPEQVRLTQFAEWTTKRIMQRLQAWRDVRPREFAVMSAYQYPAINTGVIGFAKSSRRFMQEWRTCTLQRVGFICDEMAAQLIFPWFPHIVMSDTYNASPVHSGGDLSRVVVWHGHGFKFHRRESGRRIWQPHYDAAMAEDIAGIRSWTDKVPKSPAAFARERERQAEREESADDVEDV